MSKATPWLHPGTKTYYFRVKVPARLRHLGLGAIVKEALHTKDPEAAKRLFAIRLAQEELRWKTLERGVQRLTARQAVLISREFYEAKIDQFQAGRYEMWHEACRCIVLQEYVDDPHFRDLDVQWDFFEMFSEEIDAYLDKKGVRISDDVSEKLLNMAVAKAYLQAFRENVKKTNMDFSPDPDLDRFPPGRYNGISPDSGQTPLIETFDKYAEAVKLSRATVKRWRPVMHALVEYIEHDDIQSLRYAKLVEWRDFLLKTKSSMTVRDVYLASVKAMLGWLVRERVIEENPVAGITVPRSKQAKLRSKDLSGDEALKILKATLVSHGRLGAPQAAARRWVPWICAYTGARVNEITQLRRQDIRQVDGIWVFAITPEAGTVKGNRYRDVPIHRHILDQGFLDFVEGCSRKELFYASKRRAKGATYQPSYKKSGERLAAWVRGDTVGVTDVGVSPNHGWRHRFKTEARRCGMDPEKRDVIQGHSLGTEGGNYGEFPVDMLLVEIAKMPHYDLSL